MAESDDESNARGEREKFTKERYNMDRRSRYDNFDGFEKRNDSHADQDDRSYGAPRRDFRDSRKRSFRDYDHDKKDTTGRDSHSPPSKRHRQYQHSSYDGRRGRVNQSSFANQETEFTKLECDKFKLRSFRDFVLSQEDEIDESSAVKRYREYRSLFQKSKISSFFINHQSEEWMMNRYHPRYVKELKLKRMRVTKKRLHAFVCLLKINVFDNISLTFESKNLVSLLNAVCLLLENEELPLVATPNCDFKITKTKQSDDEDGADNHLDLIEVNDDGDFSDTCKVAEKQAINDKSNIDWDQLAEIAVTKSLFVRNYPPFSKRKNLHKELKAIDCYLRLAVSEPAPRRKFSQRAWLTFKKDCDLKLACSSVNDLQSEDMDLYAVINQDIPRKIRPVDSVSTSHAAIKNDLIFAVHMIRTLDESNLVYAPWSDEVFGVTSLRKQASSSDLTAMTESVDASLEGASTKSAQQEQPFEPELYEYSSDEELEQISRSLPTKNPIWDHPLLKDFKVDEFASDYIHESDISKVELRPCEDKKLIQALDLCIMYLRVVHSVDFYLLITYLNEQDMPQRCGVINVRTSPISSQSEYPAERVISWINDRKQKVKSITDPESNKISVEEAVTVGLKDCEEERRKFFELNTVKLASDKWLCTLSGKKFRGPEYVEKHIRVKHGDKLQKVIEEVEYFNNYVFDRMRPSVPVEIVSMGANGDSAPSMSFVNSAVASAVSLSSSQSNSLSQSASNTGRKIISYSDKEAPAVDSMDFF